MLGLTLLALVIAVTPAPGSTAFQESCCCGSGGCYCPSDEMSWIPSCCASGDTTPRPVALVEPASVQAPHSVSVAPARPAEIRPESDREPDAGPRLAFRPGLAPSLFTLHASFLI
jgi:hypothetical protein